jgi:hypothetical protein
LLSPYKQSGLLLHGYKITTPGLAKHLHSNQDGGASTAVSISFW